MAQEERWMLIERLEDCEGGKDLKSMEWMEQKWPKNVKLGY